MIADIASRLRIGGRIGERWTQFTLAIAGSLLITVLAGWLAGESSSLDQNRPVSAEWVIPSWTQPNPINDLNSLHQSRVWGILNDDTKKANDLTMASVQWKLLGVTRVGDLPLAIFVSSGPSSQVLYKAVGEDAPFGGKVISIEPTAVSIKNSDNIEHKYLFSLDKIKNKF